MAATIAKAIGMDGTGRVKEVQRLGGVSSEGQANTWRTFATCYVERDGSGYVRVKRDGKTLHCYDFGPEKEQS